MHLGIAIDLAGAGEQQAGADTARQAEHVVGAQEAGFGRFDGVVLVMHRRGGTGQVPNTVHLELDRLGHVVTDKLEARMADPLGNIRLAAGKVVVEANNFLACMH